MKFNIKKLVKLLDADTATILADPKKYWDYRVQKGKNYLYIDRGANILGVAHLDTVADTVKPNDKKNKTEKVIVDNVGVNDIMVNSIKLDDRLGVFLLMDVLPYLGLKYDILLTTDEEIGMSTASNFKTKKKYNWVFSMDRHDYGTAVLYQYGTPEITNALKSLDYRIETGSFSDISELDQLGCAGINFGCGYKYEHTNSCMMRTSWLSVVVNMFVDFYGWYGDVKFNYIYKPSYSKYGGSYRYGKYSDFSYWGAGGTVKSTSPATTIPVATSTQTAITKVSDAREEWKELLSDKYDDEVVEMVVQELSLQTIPVEIIPVDDSIYTYPPYYKNGVKITAYAVEADGSWTAMGTDSDGEFYALGSADERAWENISDSSVQPNLSFEQEQIEDIIDKHVSTMLEDDDGFEYYLKHDSRAKNPKDFLHPEDFDNMM